MPQKGAFLLYKKLYGTKPIGDVCATFVMFTFLVPIYKQVVTVIAYYTLFSVCTCYDASVFLNIITSR